MINIDKIKSSELIKDPWDHKIIDNIFETDTFKTLSEAAHQLSKFAKRGQVINVFPYKAKKYGISNEVLDILTQVTNKTLSNVKDIIKDFPKHQRSYLGYFCLPHFAVTGPNFKFPIHTDSSNRTLTLVSYITPETHSGTLLYSSNNEKDFVREVEWKQNRALVLCPMNNETTWHTWKNNSDQIRVGINLSCQRLENLHDVLATTREEDRDDVTEWLLDQFNHDNLLSNRV